LCRRILLRASFLGRISTRIVNEVRSVNRVVNDNTRKPPGTIGRSDEVPILFLPRNPRYLKLHAWFIARREVP
jgi:hypothetical protein